MGLHGCLMKMCLLWAVAEGSVQSCPSFHYFLHKGFLEQHFKRISCSIIFLLVPHGLLLGSVRSILQRLDWFESQLLVPRSCWGHPQRKRNEAHTTLIPLIWIYEKNKMNSNLNKISHRYRKK